MNKIIRTIISEKINVGEIKTIRDAQNVISKISDSRVTDKDIVNAIVEIGGI